MTDASLDIPRRLNDAPRMFWWEIDVALIFDAAALILAERDAGAGAGVVADIVGRN